MVSSHPDQVGKSYGPIRWRVRVTGYPKVGLIRELQKLERKKERKEKG